MKILKIYGNKFLFVFVTCFKTFILLFGECACKRNSIRELKISQMKIFTL